MKELIILTQEILIVALIQFFFITLSNQAEYFLLNQIFFQGRLCIKTRLCSLHCWMVMLQFLPESQQPPQEQEVIYLALQYHYWWAAHIRHTHIQRVLPGDCADIIHRLIIYAKPSFTLLLCILQHFLTRFYVSCLWFCQVMRYDHGRMHKHGRLCKTHTD